MALWDVIVNGWAENKSVNVHLVIYPIGVILASVLQIMYFGISVIWVSSMIAFVSIYISFQNTEISTDYLTGLFNRRRLDEHFQRKIRMYKKEKLLFALMLDLDDFKKINDDYGHAEGDKALVAIAEILRQVCKGSDDFIVRMGGDEFLIIGERESNEEIKQLMDNISSEASELNERKVHPFQLNPSMGTSIYKSGDTKDSFFVSADKAMYQNKQEQKKLRDRNIYYQI